jgi:N-acetylmuramoyl-L-alanine amidase
MKITDDLLFNDDDTPVPFVSSPNVGQGLQREFLIIHFTAGQSAQESINWLCNPRARASAHLVISREGEVTQLVRFNKVAWHAGASEWMGRSGLNKFSLGIELDNAGKLHRVGTTWRTWCEAVIPDDEVLEAIHKNETQPAGWHTFTALQIQSALDASSLLVSQYGLKDVLGHDDIAPGRKVDPGPAFPMDSFRSKVMGRQEGEPPTLVTSTTLNIRRGPGTEFETIAVGPLAPDTPVRVLKAEGVWYQVDVMKTDGGAPDIVGWVHSRFLKSG